METNGQGDRRGNREIKLVRSMSICLCIPIYLTTLFLRSSCSHLSCVARFAGQQAQLQSSHLGTQASAGLPLCRQLIAQAIAVLLLSIQRAQRH